MIQDLYRLSKQVKLLIVQDCLSSLDELLSVEDEEHSSSNNDKNTNNNNSSNNDNNNTNSNTIVDDNCAWGQLQQLSCARNFIPKMDESLVK